MSWLLSAAGLAMVVAAAMLYNRLVAERNLALEALADIDVQLKRRAGLVPQLVEAVRGYAAAERALLEALTALRAEAVQREGVERFPVESALGARLKQLVLLQERYPLLKADANFRDLAARLAEVEDHLRLARRFYNGAVKQYVTRLESFPDLVFARLLGFRPMPFFEADEREAVKVAL